MTKEQKKTSYPTFAERGQKVVPGVSMLHERLVGRLVIGFGHLETAMQDTLWHILNVSMADGRVMTQRADANTKLQWLRTFSKRHVPERLRQSLKLLLDRIEELIDDRNFVVHGVWGTAKGETVSTPVCLSLRRKSLPDEVISESFDESRMRTIINDVTGAKDDLRTWIALLESLRKTPPEPPSPVS